MLSGRVFAHISGATLWKEDAGRKFKFNSLAKDLAPGQTAKHCLWLCMEARGVATIVQTVSSAVFVCHLLLVEVRPGQGQRFAVFRDESLSTSQMCAPLACAHFQTTHLESTVRILLWALMLAHINYWCKCALCRRPSHFWLFFFWKNILLQCPLETFGRTCRCSACLNRGGQTGHGSLLRVHY